MSNFAEAEAFIVALTGSPHTVLTWQLFDDKPEKRPEFNAKPKGTLKDLWPTLEERNKRGAGVFVQINEGDRGAKNVTGLRALFVDDDGIGPPFLLPLLPHIVVASSTQNPRNRHYYWRLKPGEPIDQFQPAQKQLIAALRTDASIHNLDRVMRLPGLYNNKRETPERVSLVFADGGRSPLTIPEVLGRFQGFRGAAETQADPPTGAAPPNFETVTQAQLDGIAKVKRWLTREKVVWTPHEANSVRLKQCPFNPDHKDFKVAVQPDGGYWAGCFHKSCGGNNNIWGRFVEAIGGWRTSVFSRATDAEVASKVMKDLTEDTCAPLKHVGSILHYNADKGVWDTLLDSVVRIAVAKYDGASCGETRAGLPKFLHMSHRFAQNCLDWIKDHTNDSDFLAEAPPGIAFQNTFLTIKHNSIVQQSHSPDNKQIFALPFDYNPDAKAPLFHKFITDCFSAGNGCAHLLALALQEFVGACLFGLAPRYERCMVLIGSQGANGKSTLLEIIAALFPPSTITAISPQDFNDPYNRAALATARMNCAGEIPEGELLATGHFKSLITGKDLVEARHPYGRPFRYRPTAGHLFSANALPATGDTTEAFWRRFLVIPFDRVVPEGARIRDLAQRIIANELPGVAAWAAGGAVRLLQQHKYTESIASEEALDTWRLDVDAIAAFLKERTRPHVPGMPGVKAKLLYLAYRDWATANGHKAMTSTSFGRRLRARGVLKTHREDGEYWLIVFVGPQPFVFNAEEIN